MRNEILLLTACVGILSGCAGSASHKVVTAHTASDESLSCSQIESEIIKTQVIIDDVNKDKNDISGADVVDGILWFPFNLIAKSENYKNALEAADRRIERLQSLKVDNNCQIASNVDRDAAVSKLSDDLEKLHKRFKSGAITEEEYKDAKQKVLDGVRRKKGARLN